MEWLRKAGAWCWNHLGNIVWIGGLCASFALPAWAAKVTGVFAQYAPLSWVVAGFLGLGFGAISMRIYASAKHAMVRAAYDRKLLAQGGEIDPLERTFERRRIYLNEFCLPSHPYIEGKTFIDCEIIGPANIILLHGNSVTEQRQPVCDAMVIAQGEDPRNGYGFRDCIFRGCSFQRITFMFSVEEYHLSARGVNWLYWTSIRPEQIAAAPPLLPEVQHNGTNYAE